MKMFFEDAAAAGFEVDLSLHWDENYAYWAPATGDGGFVGYAALREAWFNAAQALVDSGAPILQIETSQEHQLFQTSVEDHPVTLEFTPGRVQSRVIPEGIWGDKPKAQYGVELLDATLGPLQERYPAIRGRIFPGLEARAASGACNVDTFQGWGDGAWSTTDLESYYAYATSRNLTLPWTINIHRYLGLDLNSNPEETVDQVRQTFDDLYAFFSGDAAAAATRCSGRATVSPQPFGAPPFVILGEVNSAAVIDWSALKTITQGYSLSRLSQWVGGGYRQTIVMPWFFGHGADPFDPENVALNIHR
jgi:hypothetical protein